MSFRVAAVMVFPEGPRGWRSSRPFGGGYNSIYGVYDSCNRNDRDLIELQRWTAECSGFWSCAEDLL